MITISQLDFHGWKNTYRMANHLLELLVVTDIGPRVISLSLSGHKNLFYVDKDTLGKHGGNSWRLYGGHRFWHAPENSVRTCYPDNEPVKVEQVTNGLMLTGNTESSTGIQKKITIQVHPERAAVRLTHTLINHGLWPVPLAPWALSVMDVEGTAIIPIGPRCHHPEILLPVNTLSVWGYTRMADPRWTWGNEFILLRQDRLQEPQKIGLFNTQGWGAYSSENGTFIKYFGSDQDGYYPDRNTNFETWTNHQMLELESLGRFDLLQPKAQVSHTEHWVISEPVKQPENDEDVKKIILPIVQQNDDIHSIWNSELD
jgi:hypothetical protein